MTEHPTELLLEISVGAVPPPDARAHLGGCRRCQQTLTALAPLDLDYAWQGVAAELDAPRPGLLERLLVAFGVRPGLARFTATTPSLRPGWLLANALVLGLVALPLAVAPAASWPSAALLAAPLVAAAAVAFAYGPAVDPAYEAVAATPRSPLRALLVRLAAVLVANTALAATVDLALGGRGPGAGWLLPMTAASLLAVLVASCWTPMAGAAAGMGAWLLVLVAWKASQQPVSWLTGPGAQAAYATVAVALLVLLIRRMTREGCLLTLEAGRRPDDPGRRGGNQRAHPREASTMRRPTIPAIAVLLLLSSLAAGLAGSGTATAAQAIDPADPAVRSLAAEQRIPLAEAQRRIGWQVRSGSLVVSARAALGSRFGGVWTDPDTGRVKIGVVGGKASLGSLAERGGLSNAVDQVTVRHSYAFLEDVSNRLGAALVRANRGAAWGLESGLRTDRNAIELRLPKGQRLTPAQRTLVKDARRRYGTTLLLGTYQGRRSLQACTIPASGLRCDPPLRGGVNIAGPPGGPCSAGLIAKSRTDSIKYVLTAGHCGTPNSGDWFAYNYRGEGHRIGPMHRETSSPSDAAIVRIGNSYWNPKHWVYLAASPDVPDYYIINDAPSRVGDRVCLTGARGASNWGTSCSKVVAVNVAPSYDSSLRLVRVENNCALGGDSGGPYFSGHVAYGIHNGGVNGCGEHYYQDVQTAEAKLNVDVIHGG